MRTRVSGGAAGSSPRRRPAENLLLVALAIPASAFASWALLPIAWPLSVFAPVLLMLAVGGLVVGREPDAITAAGMFLIACAGIGTAALVSVPLFGPTTSGISTAQAPRHAAARTFHFTDGQALPRFEGSRRVTGRYGSTQIVHVVPVVPDTWQPGDRIPLWAAAAADDYRRNREDWAQPHRAGIRIVSFDSDAYAAAIADAERRHGLVTAPDAPLIRWVAAPEAVLATAWERFAWLVAGSLAAWVLWFAAVHLVRALRGSGATRRGRSR